MNGRWVVHRIRYRLWGAYQIGSEKETIFPSWQEAMEWVDKQTRTVEMAIPRAQCGDKVIADRGLDSLRVDYRPYCTDISLGGWDGVTVKNKHLMDLAVYLAACAKYWEETQ